jgi:MFS family permease
MLYIGAEGLTPKGLDQVVQTRATAFKVLPIAAAHPAQLYVAGSLALLALGALAVSYAAIAALVRDRGSAVATVAALIGGLGAFCGALVNVLVYPSLAAVATAHLSQDAAARFLVTAFNSGFGHAFLYAYFIGIFAAPVLMGFALWRSRSVPRWLAVLFVVGQPRPGDEQHRANTIGGNVSGPRDHAAAKRAGQLTREPRTVQGTQ